MEKLFMITDADSEHLNSFLTYILYVQLFIKIRFLSELKICIISTKKI